MTTARPVVTISAAYGTGSEAIGRRVADALDLAFLDRAIPAAVAAELLTAFADVASLESHPAHGLGQWLTVFAPLGSAWLGVPEPQGPWQTESEYLDHTESVMRRAAGRGVVIMGRGASIVLRHHPGALHVRLDGPPERRLAQAIATGGLDPTAAAKAQRQTDSARRHYVRHFYHLDVTAPSLYHLYLDATAISPSTCAAVIVRAARDRAEPSPTSGPEASGRAEQ
ncbi:MAG TPA: cytidylate kinase-like family protein [Candidatus Nanopelagicaceae bacterium]|nr:cytidylate kinase-like family protein [Candidatus Nanopelagicaceae bacterium]